MKARVSRCKREKLGESCQLLGENRLKRNADKNFFKIRRKIFFHMTPFRKCQGEQQKINVISRSEVLKH
jgi:hypothetical protein